MSETISFGGLRIAYDDRVLRPRPWTTGQSLWAAELMGQAPPGPVLELCCGAGQIGLLAVLGSDRTLVCVDAEPAACAYAADNAATAGMSDRVEVRLGRLDEAVLPDERFPVIIADPPWVRRDDTGRFPEDPVLAIDGGFDGLDVARACLAVIAGHLVPGGSALLQVGSLAQAEILRDELPAYAARLTLAEVRELAGGVLVRLDQPG
ncbi:MAG: methyltransferase [Actinomycetota bacterium]|nr:methyltransferase [Actinomycetota bacterium]